MRKAYGNVLPVYKGQFNKSGNFSMIEIRENLTLSKKDHSEVKFKDHVFFFYFHCFLILKILWYINSQKLNMFDWQNVVSDKSNDKQI